MLMTNISYIVLLQHRLEGHELGNEKPLRVQHRGSIANKLVGIFHIIEHADSGDDLGLFQPQLVECFLVPEVMDYVVSIVSEFLNKVVSRFASHTDRLARKVGEQGSVVGTDVQKDVVRLQACERAGDCRNLLQIPANGVVNTGLVPIMAGIQEFLRGSMTQLKEGTVLAQHNIKGAFAIAPFLCGRGGKIVNILFSDGYDVFQLA